MQGLILLDKTKDITSFGAVARIKHLCGEKRVGHTGTLDPLATGVLPVLIGKATALSGYMLDADKKYIATVKLGVTTDTEDITGEVIEEREVSVTQDRLEKTLQKFVGKLMQRPPMYSALKKDGIPMYERARRGEKIDIPEREITVYSLKVLESLSADNTFSFEASVSKGTYIRSLIRDIGEKLGCFAAMTSLERIETGGFSLSDNRLCEIAEIKESTPEKLSEKLIAPDEFFGECRKITLDERNERFFTNGIRIRIEGKKDEILKVYSPEGKFIALGKIFEENDKSLRMGVFKSFY